MRWLFQVAVLGVSIASGAASANPATPADAGSGSGAGAKQQPASLKLKLGHYRNKELGIGVVIDLSTVIDNVAKIPPAKLRFDGETKVWVLRGERAGQDRIDFYRDDKHVMLHVWSDGRRSVFVPDPDTDRSSDEIEVRRDGDADPL